MTDAILDRLMRLHPKLIDLELGRIERLLADVGSPHLKLPPVVHVAGTNGKGSLVAYLRAMAEAAGYRVHVYTSPHLVRFNERIRVAGELIDDDAARGCADGGRAGQPRAAHHLLRDHHGRGVPRLRARAGRPRRDRGRDGRAHGHHQRGQSRALGHHADRLRPHELPRRHAGEDRRRESGHPEACGAGGDRPPARGECFGDRRPGGRARRAAVPHGTRMAGQADARRLPLRQRPFGPRPAGAGAGRRASDRQCGDRRRLHRAAARGAVPHRRCGGEEGAGVGRLAGAPAEAHARSAWSMPCRRPASCGSTAATTRIAASCWRARPPNGRRSRPPCRST